MAVLPGESTTISFGSSVAQVLSISGPSESRSEVDTTNLDSTAKEFRFGLKDGGEITVEFQYDSASHASFHGMIDDTTASAVSIALVDADGSTNETVTCNAFMTAFELSGMGVEENVTASMTLKISGGVSY